MTIDETCLSGSAKQDLPVIFLMGPTASGKTGLAIELHKELDCDIISVDSALVYRGLDIGTAKPTTKELAIAPHHLIDICEPDQPYSVSQFCIDAKVIIEKTLSENRIPLLVGGTMLYFKALRDGLADLPKAEPNIRKQIVDQAASTSWLFMHQKLADIDPESALRIKSGDCQRIQRALEVFMISGKTLSEHFQQQSIKPLTQPILNIAIVPTDREQLRLRITQRFEQMLEQGFIAEVERLFQAKKISPELPAMRSVGYRQICQFLSGDIDYQKMQEKAITAGHRLAKRQMTWLRKWPDLNWLETGDRANLKTTKQLIETFMTLRDL